MPRRANLEAGLPEIQWEYPEISLVESVRTDLAFAGVILLCFSAAVFVLVTSAQTQVLGACTHPA